MDLGLNGKIALVTGAGKGIGRAIAERLSQEGCHLILVGRKAADLDSLAAELAARKSGRVTTAVIDFPDVQAIAKLAANHADVDIVVNNAAAIPGGSIQTIPAVVRHSYFVYKLDDFVYGRDDISKIGPLLTIVRGQIEYAAKPFSLLGENATSR